MTKCQFSPPASPLHYLTSTLTYHCTNGLVSRCSKLRLLCNNLVTLLTNQHENITPVKA